jgi:hypothetical protein
VYGTSRPKERSAVTTGTQEARKHTTVKTTVRFSFSEKEPFHHDYPAETTVGEVKAAAMTYFGVQPDPVHVFYLTHDRVRQDDNATLASVARNARAVTFRLVREIPQG